MRNISPFFVFLGIFCNNYLAVIQKCKKLQISSEPKGIKCAPYLTKKQAKKKAKERAKKE